MNGRGEPCSWGFRLWFLNESCSTRIRVVARGESNPLRRASGNVTAKLGDCSVAVPDEKTRLSVFVEKQDEAFLLLSVPCASDGLGATARPSRLNRNLQGEGLEYRYPRDDGT